MYSPPRRSFIALLFTVGLLLTACQVPLPMLPDLANTADPPMADDTSKVEESSTTETADIKAEGDATTASDANSGVESLESPSATVVVSSLRLRSGPGTEYEIVGAAPAGESFPILGQTSGCAWLNIKHPIFGAVWMSGAAQFAFMNVDCAQLAQVTEIPAPPLPPTPEPEALVKSATEPTNPASPADSAPASSDSPPGLPTDQGCFLFQNFVGPELNITVTARDWNWTDTFQAPEGGVQDYCFGPGRYTYTIDAPPPWNSINGELNVKAGEHFLFPIGREE